MKTLCKFYITVVLLITSAVANAQCTSSKPTGLVVSNITSCQASLQWKPTPNTLFYKVKYKTTTSVWSQPIKIGLDTSFVFSGLASGTSYYFAVASFCSSGSKGAWQYKNIILPACSSPVVQNVQSFGFDSVLIHWLGCSNSDNKIRYRLTTENNWIIQSTGSSQSVTLHNLVGTYIFQVSSCDIDTSWSPVNTFTVPNPNQKRPNILLIVLDDARWDAFPPNGGPSFFQSPNINRIAAEGVNFKLTIPATSQCGPSRASIYTGLYPHHHGNINNISQMNDSLPLVQQILMDHGYYTGFVGKYGQGQGLPIGFNWWAITKAEDYVDPPYVINGADTTINGNILDVYPQLAIHFLNSVPVGSPFCLMFFTRAPHYPNVPREQDSDLYLDETMPFPSNFDSYSHDVPSFFDMADCKWVEDSAETEVDRRLEFQTLAGVEDNVRQLLYYLEQDGILDSTIVVFTSDNGYLKGEHMLRGKQIAQEESILVPLFIRYPTWFKSSTIITDQFASNIDIAPTLLEVAGIPDSYNMDGLSLHALATGRSERPEFLYEFGGQNKVPPLRALRSLEYKFVHHYCNSTAEEFYDLVNDPHENNNLINDADYSSIIESYRNRLDTVRAQYGDTLPLQSKSCYLKNPTNNQEQKEGSSENGKMIQGDDFDMYPTPATDQLTVQWNAMRSQGVTWRVYDIVGRKVIQKDDDAKEGMNTFQFDLASFPAGNYLLELQTEDSIMKKIIVLSK